MPFVQEFLLETAAASQKMVLLQRSGVLVIRPPSIRGPYSVLSEEAAVSFFICYRLLKKIYSVCTVSK